MDQFSGFDLQRELEQMQIYTELADLYNTLAIITFGNTKNDMDLLLDSLFNIDRHLQNRILNEGIIDLQMESIPDWGEYHPSSIPLDQIIYGTKTSILFEASVGRIAAEMVIPYPPGIPVIQLGEIITKEMVDYILCLKEKGSRFQGIKDSTVSTIQIIERV
ncbi:hypothetical protein [Tepidibacillus marianensis]|uniref:Orn/Lys/Arg family decarboxylase n=1 Tax=Tepidibacillus marianensis TaxID=3131995 RepID=UPI00338FEE65